MKNLRCTFLWDFTHRRMVAYYQHFGTSYRSHLQGYSSPRILQVTQCSYRVESWNQYIRKNVKIRLSFTLPQLVGLCLHQIIRQL
jgi:hypothetical protein